MRLLYLTLDLRLADHHGIEAGGDAEEVDERVLVETGDRVLRAKRTEIAQHVVRGGALVNDGEYLEAIAGRKKQHLADPGNRLEAREPIGKLLGGHRELLAHGDWHLLVRETGAEEGRHAHARPRQKSTAAAEVDACGGAARRPA